MSTVAQKLFSACDHLYAQHVVAVVVCKVQVRHTSSMDMSSEFLMWTACMKGSSSRIKIRTQVCLS